MKKDVDKIINEVVPDSELGDLKYASEQLWVRFVRVIPGDSLMQSVAKHLAGGWKEFCEWIKIPSQGDNNLWWDLFDEEGWVKPETDPLEVSPQTIETIREGGRKDWSPGGVLPSTTRVKLNAYNLGDSWVYVKGEEYSSKVM